MIVTTPQGVQEFSPMSPPRRVRQGFCKRNRELGKDCEEDFEKENKELGKDFDHATQGGGEGEGA